MSVPLMLDLKFKVAPHAIEDLGSNLYTGFPRVLAEFVANAYDADASEVRIAFDFEKVDGLRRAMRRHYEEELAAADGPIKAEPLANRKLPDIIAVEIRDNGFGMTYEDVSNRFLWAARKRRNLDPIERTMNRPLMGRKGLGKLAGFGVAAVLEVITKTKNDSTGIRFCLDYDKILENEALSSVPVESSWDNTTFRPGESGTIIRLKRLAFEAVKSKAETIDKELSEHFEFISPDDCAIYLNDKLISRPERKFAFAWPDLDRPVDELCDHELETELGPIKFQWRMRFRSDHRALAAAKRGVRIYASNRMAASPSLFDADTNMHGFRMTDYLDGIVRADFIDTQPQDYIATDRQSLRWDTPLLSPLKQFLSEQIKEACKEYQKVRDTKKVNEVLEDEFTLKEIEKGAFGRRELRLMKAVAVRLARYSKQGVRDTQYREVLPQIVRAVGHGELYQSLSQLAEMEAPNMAELLADVVRLNRSELDGSTAIIRSRLRAIDALTREVERLTGAGEPRNEREIQQLFEEAPWLMNPTYHDYLTADKAMNTTLTKLAEHLGVADPKTPQAATNVSRKEADFVFLMGQDPLRYVLIVELKAATKPAEVDDILQLRMYLKSAGKWLRSNGQENVGVRGELICSPPPRDSRRREEIQFWNEAEEIDAKSDHQIRPYIQVLNDTKAAHENILRFADRISHEDPEDEAGSVGE